MDFIKKNIVIILVILLLLALITSCIFGFMWGKSASANKQLKQDKTEYLQIKSEQDSIITASQNKIIKLTESIDNLVSNAIVLNDGTSHIIIDVQKDKQRMHEEIHNVHTFTVDSIVRLFNREADSYVKPR